MDGVVPDSREAESVKPPRARWSRGKRLLAALIAPVVFLLLAEGVLRAVGFGHPTSYFIPSEKDPGVLVENADFGRRFLPAGLLRLPPPTKLTRLKAPGAVRIFVFGESAAMGDPKPAFGVARFLEVILKERFPGPTFEVIPVAMTAINSHALLPMARQCARLGGDYWIVYAGNNEMLGPFGAGSVLGGHAPPRTLVRLILAARATRVGQAFDAIANRLRGRAQGSTRWAGIRVLAGDTVTGDAPERVRVHDAFQGNLEALVEAGREAGVRVLLSTMAVNLRDCAPFGSMHRPGLSSDDIAEWDRSFVAGRGFLARGDTAAALEQFQEALSVDDRHAGLHFSLGEAWLGQSNQIALEAFIQARDLDTIPLRTDSALNAILRKVASEHGAGLIDATRSLAESAPEGIPGGELFYEHVHFTPEGNYALARLFAEALAAELPQAARAQDTGAWPAFEPCATQLALTPWARYSAVEMMLARCMDAPFTNRLNHDAHIAAMAGEAARQRRARTPESAEFVRGIIRDAIAAAPEDHHLHRVYAEFLDANGDLSAAAEQWLTVRDLLPHHPMAYLQAGNLLRRAGRIDEARPLIEKAVAMQPEWAEAHAELGELLLARGRPGEAIPALRAALRLHPGHARTHLRLADALAADRQRDAAITNLQEAVRLDPRLWEARYFLGVEYAIMDRIEAAREQFKEVVRLRPDHARAQFNLGIALARKQEWGAAAEHLREALRLDPSNKEARQALAEIAARQGTLPAH
jgi:tetratricopeptide (TPR) repeat protein